ncbi:MAG: hypothetical protein LBN93_09705 [Candidatus Symbiothrix sp.]|jgi:hypothetical protein|nr:hypothetical protein [Candidatus Symbiothrix sp.]
MRTKNILILAVLAVSLAACSNKKTEGAATCCEKADSAVVEVAPVVETPVLAPADALKEFKAFAKSYGEAFNNLTKDPNKYTELAGQVQAKVAELEAIKDKLKPAELKEYEKAKKIITDVNSGGTKTKK